jgi:hypothetical protein
MAKEVCCSGGEEHYKTTCWVSLLLWPIPVCEVLWRCLPSAEDALFQRRAQSQNDDASSDTFKRGYRGAFRMDGGRMPLEAGAIEGMRWEHDDGEIGCAVVVEPPAQPLEQTKTALPAAPHPGNMRHFKGRHMGGIWSALSWMPGTSVLLALTFGIFSKHQRGPAQALTLSV